MIAENNFFIETFLYKFGTNRKMTEEEKAYYAAPYPTVASRKPVETWHKEIPFDGKGSANYDEIYAYSQWLEASTVPKLLLYAKPGMILKKDVVAQIQQDFIALESVYVGIVKHFLQVDHPHEIGKALKSWAEGIKSTTTAKAN